MKKFITALMLLASPTLAQNFPNRGITIVVPFAAGGPTDVVARIVGEHMSRTLGQAVVVENVAGAGGTTASTRVAKATPDGYTLVMGNLGTHSASVGLYGDKLQYDPRVDFAPIINTAGTPMYVAAHKEFPANTLQEFITLIKANPTKYNYGHGGIGSTSHLTCIFFHHLVGAPVQQIPFRGSGPAMNALIGKQLDYVCDQSVGIVPQLTNLKAYVVATPTRVAVSKDVPTSEEAGLKQFQAVGWNALFAPKGTPQDIIDKLNAAGKAALADENVRKRLLDLGCNIPDLAGQTPDALLAHVKAEVDKWTPVIKAAGVKAE